MLGQVDFNSNGQGLIKYPHGMTIDPAGRVLVADTENNRILIWNAIPLVNNAPPDYVLGQSTVGSTAPNRGGAPGAATLRCPLGVWSDGQKIVVADFGNNRVLIWNSFWSTPSIGAPADVVVGQSTMTEGPPASASACDSAVSPATSSNLGHPAAAAISGSKLFVADTNNNRILTWFTVPASNGVPASLVLGQADFESREENRGGLTPTASTLKNPYGIHSDGTRLFVTDSLNHRVLIWNALPASTDPNGMPADLVLGQPSMTSGVPNREFSRPDRTIPSDRTMNAPVAVTTYGGMMAVTDHYNHRVLLYHQIPTSSYASANDEIGHGRFTSNELGTSNSTLNHPWGISLSSGGIAVGDKVNNRVLVFPSPLPASGNVTAVADSSLGITVSWSGISGASGYRIYRDGFWLGDLPSTQVSLTDPNLSPDTYRYSVSPLSDENRVEGSSMGSASATASGTLPGLVVVPHSSYDFYLAEGDSVASEDNAYPDRPEHMYPQQIANYLPVESLNGAKSGSSCVSIQGSVSIQDRLSGELATHNPDLVTIGIGLNDSTFGYAGTHGWVSMAAYRDCMRTMIQTVNPGPNRTLLLLNFHHMTNWKMNDPDFGITGAPDVPNSNGSDEKKRAWNKVIRDVAAHAGVPLVDVTAAMGDALVKNPERDFLLDRDKVHPDQAGQDVIAQAVLDQLLNFLPPSEGPARPGQPKTPTETVVTDAESEDVGFSWEPSTGPLRSADPYQIQWSQDATFTRVSGTATTNTAQIILNLPRGKTYVKVRGYSPANLPGPWSLGGRVLVTAPPVGDPPPSPTAPTTPGRPLAHYGGDTVQGLAERKLRIFWGASGDGDGIRHYEVEWVRLEGSESVGSELAYRGDRAITDQERPHYDMQRVLPAGVWKIRVRAVDMSGEMSSWSEPGIWISPMVDQGWPPV